MTKLHMLAQRERILVNRSDGVKKNTGELLTGLGTLVGVMAALALDRYALIPTSVHPWSVLLAIGMMAFVGLFFGLYPAARASALNPIDRAALRVGRRPYREPPARESGLSKLPPVDYDHRSACTRHPGHIGRGA